MKGLLTSMLLSVGFLMAVGAQAQVPAGAPAGTTALCKDGSYASGAEKKGACRGHKGVKDWYGGATGAAAASTGTAAQPETKASKRMTKKQKEEAAAASTGTAATGAAAPSMASPAAAAAPMPSHAPAAAANPASHMAAPGGGAGQVWVNDESKVYHCPSDRYYGKTKKGEYMSEADAIAKGNHASGGKACAK